MILLITPIALPCLSAIIIHNTIAAMPNAPPTMWDTILKISSPFV